MSKQPPIKETEPLSEEETKVARQHQRRHPRIRLSLTRDQQQTTQRNDQHTPPSYMHARARVSIRSTGSHLHVCVRFFVFLFLYLLVCLGFFTPLRKSPPADPPLTLPYTHPPRHDTTRRSHAQTANSQTITMCENGISLYRDWRRSARLTRIVSPATMCTTSLSYDTCAVRISACYRRDITPPRVSSSSDRCPSGFSFCWCACVCVCCVL